MQDEEIVLLSTNDVKELTGWGIRTVRKVMNEKDFPLIKIGRKNQVEKSAFKEYLNHKRELRGEE